MLCELPMFSFKFHKDDPSLLKNKRIAFALLVLGVILVCVLCSLNWSAVILLSLGIYILKNIVYAIAKI